MRLFRTFMVVAGLILLVPQLFAQNPANPIQLALLRWYSANTATQVVSGSTCSSPKGLAFDGSHMWVACSNSAELQEFNTSDNATVATISLAGTNPFYLLYDGANIWALSTTAGTLTEVQASTGAIVRTVTIGAGLGGFTFDGTYIWVSNTTAVTVTKVLATTGAIVSTTSLSGTCSLPTAMAYDSVNAAVWVVCNGAPAVAKLSSTGTVVKKVQFGSSLGALNMVFDGTNLWVSSREGSTFSAASKINVTTAVLTSYSLPVNSMPVAVTFDGLYIWAAENDGHVTKLVASTGVIVSTYPTGGNSPVFAAFDGGNIWIANGSLNLLNQYTISKM